MRDPDESEMDGAHMIMDCACLETLRKKEQGNSLSFHIGSGRFRFTIELPASLAFADDERRLSDQLPFLTVWKTCLGAGLFSARK